MLARFNRELPATISFFPTFHDSRMHILIVKLSSIGDVVHALPAAAALRASFPEARLTWVVERIAAPLLIGSPILDEVIVLDTRGWRKRLSDGNTWASIRKQIKELRQFPVDVALDFQGLFKSAGVGILAGATQRIGFSSNALREPACRFGYTRQIQVDNAHHVIENNLALATAIGAEMPVRYEFPFPALDEETATIRTQLERHDIDQFVILNPGGGWVTKLWPAAEYGRLANEIWKRFRVKSIVTCGPGEEKMAETITAASRHAVYFPTSLREFIALVRQAELFVGSDTGPLHLAAACRTPIVGIYGPTAPERNGPFNLNDRTIGLNIPCRLNCHRRTCNNHICMNIPLESVLQAVENRIDTSKFLFSPVPSGQGR